MKLIIQGERIAATATDAYNGPEVFINAPADFDTSTLGKFRVVDGELLLSVPETVKMAQARAALIIQGLMTDLVAALAGIPGVQGDLARNAFEYGTTVSRSGPLVLSLKPALGLTDAQLDDLFVLADTL